jgi:D-tyrosyl-tRNA(Tyr) deacylase
MLMRAVIQRVSQASVRVEGKQIGQISHGLLVFLCVMQGDTLKTAEKMVSKIVNMRIFKDEKGRMNRALHDSDGDVLLISQFTLAADLRGGNRPGFSAAAPPETGQSMYKHCIDTFRAKGVLVQTGVFGANMEVSLVNDGPVTISVEI